MFRIVSASIEMLSAAVFIVPIFLLCDIFYIHSMKRTLMYLAFGLYLSVMLALVGFPDISSIKIDFTVNVIPFVGMIADFTNEVLNVVLFIPLGIILPIMWNQFRNVKYLLMVGILLSIVIEISQIFTFRLTDINDVITNTVGTIIGFVLYHLITKRFSRDILEGAKISEFYIVSISVLVVMFFIQPFVSTKLWEVLL